MLYGVELATKLREYPTQILMLRIATLEETSDATPLIKDMTQRTHEILQILAIEGAVYVTRERCYLGIRGVENKILWRVIHISHHTVRALHNSLAVTPRNGRGEESRNLNISRIDVGVRNTNRIGLDETLVIEFIVQRLKEFKHLLV